MFRLPPAPPRTLVSARLLLVQGREAGVMRSGGGARSWRVGVRVGSK